MASTRRFVIIVAATGSVAALLLAGASAAGAAGASPSSLDFGSVAVGQTATLTDVVTPDPGYSVNGATGSGLNPPWALGPGNCVPDQPCTITESFTPSAIGTVTGELDMTECPDGGGQCVAIPIQLSGTGFVPSGTMTAGPATVAAGSPITATSITPCPPGSSQVALKMFLLPDGTLIKEGLATITDSTGDWGGAMTVPTNVAGSILLTATCNRGGLILQNYNDVGITVTPSATTTSLSTSGSPSDYGQPVTFRAVVSGAGIPTGSVGFFDGSTNLGTVPLVGGGAQLTTSTLSLGSHTITAVYTGSGATSSASLTQVVQRAPTQLVAATERRANPTQFSATLTSDGSPLAGQSVTFTTKKSFGATVVQCTATTNGNGVATCSGKNAFSLASARAYTASYAGTGDYFAASATGRLTS